MYRDKAMYVILNRDNGELTRDDALMEAVRSNGESGAFSACHEAREFSQLHPCQEVTVWEFTLANGARPVARYRNGAVDADGVAALSNHLFWCAGAIMYVVSEYLSQQALIMDMESDPDNTALAPCDDVELPSPSRP